MTLPHHPFGHEIREDDILARFSPLTHWEARYRELILLSRQLPILDDSTKECCLVIKGCENKVWLGHEKDEKGYYHFCADSEGRIVKGLLALLLVQIEGKTAEQIKQKNLATLFEQLNLLQQLSGSRQQGLQSIIKSISELVINEC